MGTVGVSKGALEPGERTRKILSLALPIIGGMISQNVLNLVDTAMVGSEGSIALAAVGTGSFANFMAIAFIMGFSAGVQAMSSRRMGEGREREAAVPLNGALLLVLLIAIPWAAILYLSIPTLFPFLNGDPQVVEIGVPYLQARILGGVAVGMNFAFRGYWNAVEKSNLYLRTLLVMHASNIFLNWVLIFGNLGAPAYGAVGAGIASCIATYIGCLFYIGLGLRHARENGFLRGLPDRETVRTMLRLSVPNGLQQLFFSAGFVMLFSILGRMGTHETAAASVLINVMLVAILPGLGFGLAATSLVGQALGRGSADDAKRWGWDVVKVSTTLLAVLGLLMVLFPEQMLQPFLKEPEVLALAKPALMVFGASIGLDGCGLVLQNAMLGAGASRRVMLVSISLQWGLFLPASYIVGPVLGLGLIAVWIAQAVQRALQAMIYIVLWHRGEWAKIKV